MKQRCVIAVGYAKQALAPHSREQKRMRAYAQELGGYHLIVFTRRGDKLPPEFHTPEGLHVYGTHTYTRLGALVRAVWLGRTIARSAKTSLVLSSQDPFETSLVTRLIGWRHNAEYQVQLHGDFYGSNQWRQESAMNRLRAFFGRWVLQRATRIRTVSTRIARSLTALGIAAEKVTVLPIQVELDTFLAVGKKRSYGTPTTHRFVFVGRLAPEKNLTVLLQAFADLYKTHKNVSLELVGKGPEHDKLMAHVAQLGLEQVVKFTPWSEEVATILAGADTFVLPSRHEGHAIVLLEAMAAGLPVVTTDVGCVGELVHDSVQGQVVLPTAPAITEAMTRYVSDPALHRRHAGAAYQTAQTIAARQERYLTEWKVALMGE